ncbi:MAG: hypothetical protein ABJD11_15005 [Gemmatimonadota bacterium]
MSKPAHGTSVDKAQDDQDPHRREELERAMRETGDRLRAVGVTLTGHESSEQLVALLEAVERFERAVESRGGDLMVDEGPKGRTREPDDVHNVLPSRQPQESVPGYLGRIDQALQELKRRKPTSR